jgi:hypothetical protein
MNIWPGRLWDDLWARRDMAPSSPRFAPRMATNKPVEISSYPKADGP